ncbi:retrovirus-related pol polyprotein from transposon TNT 1-94 [Tanacetum coccineum]
MEAVRTMLIFSKALMFLWVKAIATTCYTQNQSLIYTLHNKTPYELVHDKKLNLYFLHVFGALCYPTNDSEDLGKLKSKADIGFFVGYAPNRKGYRIYNKRTRQIMETIHVYNSNEPDWGKRLSQVQVNPTGPSVSISVDQDAPSGSHSPSFSDHQSSSVHHSVAAKHSFEVNPFAPAVNKSFVIILCSSTPSSEDQSSWENYNKLNPTIPFNLIKHIRK